jgi:hypothetical protein
MQTKPGLKYILSTVFKKFHTCLHESSVSSIFKLDPLTLEGYIEGLKKERNDDEND